MNLQLLNTLETAWDDHCSISVDADGTVSKPVFLVMSIRSANMLVDLDSAGCTIVRTLWLSTLTGA